MPDLDAIAHSASEWIGREERAIDEVTGQAARRLAATLDLPTDGFETGSPLPPGWHVILFPPLAPTGRLGPDGHPINGEFLPDLPLPRRMFAERKFTTQRPLRVGERIERRSRIAAIEPKTGRSGHLAFVTVIHDFIGADGLAMTEEQKIVYREEARADATQAVPRPAETLERTPTFETRITPNAALLFRYSAVTFNAHRIHYDQDYTQGVETYPERVVNGGLTAIMMLRLVSQNIDAPIKTFSVRNKQPLFVNQPVRLACLSDDSTGCAVYALNTRDEICSHATLGWGDA